MPLMNNSIFALASETSNVTLSVIIAVVVTAILVGVLVWFVSGIYRLYKISKAFDKMNKNNKD